MGVFFTNPVNEVTRGRASTLIAVNDGFVTSTKHLRQGGAQHEDNP
jgi:hypothetical protein